MIFDDRLSGTSLDITKSTNSLGFEQPSGTTVRNDRPERQPRIPPIRLSVAETARLTRLAAQTLAGLVTRARLAFVLRWSARRRRHQAAARWHHHSTRLNAAAT